MKYTKIIFSLLLTLLIVSCGGSSDDAQSLPTESGEKKPGLRHYPGSDFSLKIPASWNLVTDNNEVVPSPKNGTIELAVTSTETKGGFANNLIVLSQELPSYTTSKDYSIVNNIGAENEYLNYTKLVGKDFSFSDGEKSRMYIFEAKYSELTPVLKFIQTAYVCNTNKAFFFTIALSNDIKDTAKYEEMLKTFACK